ncbi:MAG: Gfo/Idh/MocA family oxidoreductase [Saprospiraceae bacterium]|nr:Gfo/Idh/MocA family oxidoreductase [Saprospiraceae bacterium]
MNKLKIGVLGAGHLGKIHIRCLQQANESYDLVGFFDTHTEQATKVSRELNVRAFDSVESLIEEVDVVDVVTPTIYHFELAKAAILRGRHVFIEKPLTHTVAEAEELLVLTREKGVKVQVGHVERFNPAFLSLGNISIEPMFVEAHRLASFNPRGTDVSVVLDLMIHDIDLVLHLVKSEVKAVHASGVAVISASPDIANARIEFENGCVANLTASRMSLKQMRKVRFFQRDAYLSLDFLEKKAQIIRLRDENTEGGDLMAMDTARGKKWIDIKMPEPIAVNAIQMELETFAYSILNNTEPKVTIEDGYRALKVAHQIIEVIGDTTLS